MLRLGEVSRNLRFVVIANIWGGVPNFHFGCLTTSKVSNGRLNPRSVVIKRFALHPPVR
jgi:hypothetical protein